MKQITRIRIYKRIEFNFVNDFKKDFEAKSSKDFINFERYGRIKKENIKTETGVRVTMRRLFFLNLFYG